MSKYFTLIAATICVGVLCTLLEVSASDPYCHINETSETFRPVLRTRTVIKKPSGPFKLFKKPKTITENYVEQVKHISWKLVSQCCEGYKMTHLQVCEPTCAQGCPANAQCVEVNSCRCRRGYISAESPTNGSRFCEPICSENCPVNGRCVAPNLCECERGYRAHQDKCLPHCSSGCPFNGECIQPNVCSCQEGYRSEAGTCLPNCHRGEGCLHGKCIDTETCLCDTGYELDEEGATCLPVPCEGECENESSSEQVHESEESTQSTVDSIVDPTESAVTTETDYDWSEFDKELDENEKIYLSTPDTYTEDFLDSVEHVTTKCEHGFLYYRGECRPEVFPSNEVDCKFRACSVNAMCLENGTCSCEAGFIWHMKSSTENTENASTELVCISLQELHLLGPNTNAGPVDEDSYSIYFISIGVGCILLAAIVLGVVFMRHQRGRLYVETSNDLCCEYDSFRKAPMVL